MIKAGRYVVIIALLAVFMLAYVNVQVNLFKVSYQIELKQKTLDQLSEQYKHLNFRIAQHISPPNLEGTIHNKNLEFIYPENFKLVRNAPKTMPAYDSAEGPKAKAGFWDFLIKEAQAKTD